MTTSKHREPMSETEALRLELEMTRQHLADTVQELTRQLNVPRRIKESAGQAGHRVRESAGQAGSRVRQSAGHAGQLMKENAGVAGQRMKEGAGQLPATTKQHPKAAAAVGGAVLLGAGAVAWMATRNR